MANNTKKYSYKPAWQTTQIHFEIYKYAENCFNTLRNTCIGISKCSLKHFTSTGIFNINNFLNVFRNT